MTYYCEDYPACGHGPAPWGDDGGCPDPYGRFECVLCRQRMPAGAHSAICEDCRSDPRRLRHPDDPTEDY